jgi:spore coat protein A, manganese oxidase
LTASREVRNLIVHAGRVSAAGGTNMPVSRRDILKVGLAAAPSLALTRLAEAQIGDPGSPTVFPFRRALPIPATLSPTDSTPTQDTYDITMQEALADIIPGRPTPVWTYNGTYPGPTIRARAGAQAKTVVVNQTNDLPQAMSVHLHGAHVLPTSDGHPNDLITPNGGTKPYTYPNTQLPATLWYHDHAVDVTGPHVYMGLAGFYIQSDDVEDALGLPSGSNDVPLLVQDRLFNRNGSFAYPLSDDAINRGVIGDRILVNGVIQPFHAVTRRKVRFRLLNGSNSRIYDFRLSNGQPFIQIGSDGGLLPLAVPRTMIRLGPAERADVVIDFTDVPSGTSIYLRNTNRMIALNRDRAPREILRFDVGGGQTVTAPITALRTFTPPGLESVTRQFTLGRIFLPDGRPVWQINGQTYNQNVDLASPTNGATELWTFQNNSNLIHPMHIHLVQFQIQTIGGLPPALGDNGWKDTVNVPPLSNAVVKMRFATFDNSPGFTGRYVFHCHVLEHEDMAMMAQFNVTP